MRNESVWKYYKIYNILYLLKLIRKGSEKDKKRLSIMRDTDS